MWLNCRLIMVKKIHQPKTYDFSSCYSNVLLLRFMLWAHAHWFLMQIVWTLGPVLEVVCSLTRPLELCCRASCGYVCNYIESNAHIMCAHKIYIYTPTTLASDSSPFLVYWVTLFMLQVLSAYRRSSSGYLVISFVY